MSHSKSVAECSNQVVDLQCINGVYTANITINEPNVTVKGRHISVFVDDNPCVVEKDPAVLRPNLFIAAKDEQLQQQESFCSKNMIANYLNVFFWKHLTLGVGGFSYGILILIIAWTEVAAVQAGVWLLAEYSGLTDTELTTVNRNYYCLFYLGCICVEIVATLLRQIVLIKGVTKASSILHDKLLFNILHAPMSYFDLTSPASIMYKFSYDLHQIDTAVVYLATEFFQYGFHYGIVICTVLTVVLPLLALAAFFIFCSLAYLMWLFRRKKSTIEMEHHSQVPVFQIFLEMLTGLQSIRAYGAERGYILAHQSRCNRHTAILVSTTQIRSRIMSQVRFVGNFFLVFCSLLIVTTRNTVSNATCAFILLNATFATITIQLYVERKLELDEIAAKRQALMDAINNIPAEGTATRS